MLKKKTISKLFFKDTRIFIINLLKKIILGNFVGNIPHNTIRDINEVLYKKQFIKLIDIVDEIDDAHIEDYNFPKDYPLRFPRKKSYNAKYIYSIKDVVVSSNSGAITLPNQKKILLQSVGSLNRLLSWGGVLHDLLPGFSKITKVSGQTLVYPDTGFFHWLLEVLPNFLECLNSSHKNSKIIIHPNTSSYALDALKYVLGNDWLSRIIEVENKAIVENIKFASFEDNSGFVRRHDIQILRFTFKELIKNTLPQKKIYLSRLKASKRRIGNELDVEKMVKLYGYQVVYAEDLSFEEQIKIFSESSHIISPHGAGLSNIIWCNSGTNLIEIFSFDNLHSCYATLALTRNMNYQYLNCIDDKNSYGIVNLKQLSDILSLENNSK